MTELTAVNGSGRPQPNGKASYAEKHKLADHFIGGNRLANAPPSKVKDFVAQNDGHTVITNVSLPCQIDVAAAVLTRPSCRC